LNKRAFYVKKIEMNAIARHIIFTGRVQGVGFRFTALDLANRHRLTGFVRNRADGTVEMVAQGSDEQINALLQDIQARYSDYITETKINETPSNPQFKDFKITF
jgi:acylphosphatase